MTLFLPPAVHYGYHPLKQTSGDSDCIDPSVLGLPHSHEMTKNNDAGYGYSARQPATLDLESWTLDLPFDGQSVHSLHYVAPPASDATKSPGRSSRQQSSGRSDCAASPIVYTPSSGYEYDAPVNDGSDEANEDEADASRSPLSDSIFSSTTDSSFYLVDYPESGEIIPTERPISHTVPRHQAAMSRSSGHPSRASSVAKSSTSHHTASAQWDATTPAVGGIMSQNVSGPLNDGYSDQQSFAYPSTSYELSGHQDAQYELMSDLAIPDDNASNTYRNITQNSFRAFETGTHHFPYSSGASFNQTMAPSQQLHEEQHYLASQYQQPHNLFQQLHLLHHQGPSNAGSYGSTTVSPTPTPMVSQAQMPSSSAHPMTQVGNIPIRPQQSRVVVHQSHQSNRATPYQRSHLHPTHQPATYPSGPQRRKPAPSAAGRDSIAPSRRMLLAPRADQRPHVLPSNTASVTLQNSTSRKGGRARHTHLPDDVRQQTSKMRGVTACWRCALQRDKCDDNEICRRCSIRSQKGQRDLFGCDRSKLPEWIDDLLPGSMTDMHSRKSIETYVAAQVTRWNTSNAIDIYLTSGYGPALMWRCCEFQPRDHELLGQLQYLQDSATRTEQRRLKYSPPFALEKLDESDDARFQDYLDNQLMQREVLNTLGWSFYQEECLVDPQCFQAQVLQLLCTLFIETQDAQLRDALHDIIRMLIVTYIMGHTLTITEDILPTVLASVRYTPAKSHPEQHTSPRLANRQLKHYFSSLRHNTYLKVLHRQQQTFHDSKKKEAHWLVSFCAMLGLAMVLEEVQITLHVQADAKWFKGEMAKEAANVEAHNHCQGIDDKFARLVFYFQKKYRDRKWGDDGSFGHGTPNYRTVPEKKFLRHLYELLVKRQDHLHARESVPLGPQYQCQYTTRLVAKFLLPFLNLNT